MKKIRIRNRIFQCFKVTIRDSNLSEIRMIRIRNSIHFFWDLPTPELAYRLQGVLLVDIGVVFLEGAGVAVPQQTKQKNQHYLLQRLHCQLQIVTLLS